MEANRGPTGVVFGVILRLTVQQKRSMTRVTSASPKQSNGSKQKQKRSHPVHTRQMCLIVEFQLSRQLPDGPASAFPRIVVLV